MGRAHGVGADNRQAGAESLIYDDAPAIVTAGQDEDVGLGEILWQLLRRLKALVSYVCARYRTQGGKELRKFRLAPDEEQPNICGCGHQLLEGSEEKID